MSIKTKMQSLIDASNAKTGKGDTDLTAAVQSLISESGGGATFTPSVSADGTLSWTNNKGLTNPEPVNIKGPQGADGKSAYQYAVESGYTGTETEFAEKLASGALIVRITDNNGTLTADKSYIEIRDAIVAGIPVLVDYIGSGLPLIAMGSSLFFGTIMCEETSVATLIIEITENDEVNDISAQADIPSAVTDAHINSLIDTKLGVIENGSY